MIEDERPYGQKLGIRIATARGSVSQAEFAKRLGISKNTILRYEKGYSIPDVETLLGICEEAGADINWLIAGEGPFTSPDIPYRMLETPGPVEMAPPNKFQPRASNEKDKIVIPDWKKPGSNLFDYVPMVEAKLLAGGSRFAFFEAMRNCQAFRKDWLHRVASSPKNLVLMRVQGRSMDPTIQDGDTVMIDTGQRDIREGMIYALRVDSTVMIKRLSFRIGGKVSIISDNKTYAPYEADTKDLHVIGQIIFFCRSFVPD